MATKDSIELSIQEVQPRDIGHGIVRIDHDSMNTLNVVTGDIIEIKGKRRTVAKCFLLHHSEKEKGIIRTDELTRFNSGTSIGDTVVIKKIKSLPAEIVVVYPIEVTPLIDERYFAEALENTPLIKGDNLLVPYFGSNLIFEVIWARPNAEAILVNHKTIFHIAKESEVELQKKMEMEILKEMNTSDLNEDFKKLSSKLFS